MSTPPDPDNPAGLASTPWQAAELDVRAALHIQAESAPAPAPERLHDVNGAPRVTTVILSYNRPEFVLGALHSLFHASQPPSTALVFDNGSDASTRSILREACAGHPQIRVHYSDRNLGCAGGRQAALELVSSELVLFLDDDAELLPGALGHLLAELDRSPATIGVSATIVLPDGRVSASGGCLEQGAGTVSFTLIDSGMPFDDPARRPAGACHWITGCAALCRRDALEQHPLDPGMAAYYEDTEWCFRVAQATPPAARPSLFRHSCEALVVHHAKHKSWGQRDLQSRAQWVRFIATAAHFYRKHRLLLVSPGTDLFALMPELMRTDGTRDLVGARLIMELAGTHTQDWLLMEWMNGGLDPVLGVQRTKLGDELHAARLEINALRAELERARSQPVSATKLGRGLPRWIRRTHRRPGGSSAP